MLIAVAGLLLFYGCKPKQEPATTENEVDAARNFIRAALDGRWEEAARFVLPDSTNRQLLDALKTNWSAHMAPDEKRGYQEASIKMYDTRNLHDSAVVVQYANSFKNKKDSLKVLRRSGQWLVDLKFSFPQTDTSHHAQ